MTNLKIAVLLVMFAALSPFAAFAQIIPPGGRLTLTSNTPVMTGDVTNTSTIYYVPYVGNSLPIANGSSVANSTLNTSQLTLTLNSSYQTAGNIYDIFEFVSSGFTLCAGPAWSNPSASPWRGTGAGTSQLTQLNGIWVNAVTITTCNNGVNNNQFVAKVGVYLGSIYIPITAGQTSVNFKPTAAAGGSNNVVGIWNAYNRVRIFSLCADSNTSWTDSSSSWEALDFASSSGVNNRVTYLDGLAQSSVKGRVTTIAYNATAGNGVFIGVDEDSTTNAPSVYASQQSATSGTTVGSISFAAEENFFPALGLHYLQGMQWSPNATTATFGFNGSSTFLLFDGEY
jgi:hypothetical protein